MSLRLFPIQIISTEIEKKTILVYYGVCRHGKGLVDAMSGFGVKGPLCKAIITRNAYFHDSRVIFDYLEEKEDGSSSSSFFSPLLFHASMG